MHVDVTFAGWDKNEAPGKHNFPKNVIPKPPDKYAQIAVSIPNYIMGAPKGRARGARAPPLVT